jgi:hypothetical protein
MPTVKSNGRPAAPPEAARQPDPPAQPPPKRRRGPYVKRAPRNYTEADAEQERAAMQASFDARAKEAEERMEKLQAKMSVW